MLIRKRVLIGNWQTPDRAEFRICVRTSPPIPRSRTVAEVHSARSVVLFSALPRCAYTGQFGLSGALA
jgi:hypothetical protein